MPTILRSGPYRVYFVSHDCREPAHVHVDRDMLTAKFWLQPLRLASAIGFATHELRDIERLVSDNRERCLEVWHEHCGRASD